MAGPLYGIVMASAVGLLVEYQQYGWAAFCFSLALYMFLEVLNAN